MNEKEIASLSKKSLFTVEFSLRDKESITNGELIKLTQTIRKHMKLSKTIKVLIVAN
jgi:hypothetical protein